jgi:hypothetical protein
VIFDEPTGKGWKMEISEMRQSATDKTDEFQRQLIEFWRNHGIDC